MIPGPWRPHRPPARADAGPGYLQRRVDTGTDRRLALLERRRRIATCLVCGAGALGFFALYVLSWVLVLSS